MPARAWMTGLLLLLPLVPLGWDAPSPDATTPDRPPGASRLASLPATFEANHGQAPGDARFVARAAGYRLLLEEAGPLLLFDDAAVRIRFDDALPRPTVRGAEPLPTRSHYLLGDDPSAWRTDVPHFARVVYEGVYPGIDVVFRGIAGREIEYDVLVAPGADASQVRVRLEGADEVRLDADGSLVATVGPARLRQHAPFAYQESDGRRDPVESRFVLHEDASVGFLVGAYDRARPLVIDPALTYSTYLGGSGAELGWAIAVDGSGNAYVTGQTTPLGSAPYPTTVGAYQTTPGGLGADAFVTKLNAGATAIVYSTFLGGLADDFAYDIQVDGAGNAHVVGNTVSLNFPTVNPITCSAAACGTAYSGASHSGGYMDVFVARLNAAGSALLFSSYLGGVGYELGRGIALDAAGMMYVTGPVVSPNTASLLATFPTTLASYQPASTDARAAYLSKIDPATGLFTYSTFHSAPGGVEAHDVAVDGLNRAYVTGWTASTSFPVVNPINCPATTCNGAYSGATLAGFEDAFVTRFTPAGDGIQYSTYLGSPGTDVGVSVVVDGANRAHVTGNTGSNATFPTTLGAFDLVAAGMEGFVARLPAAGNNLDFSTFLGGSGDERMTSVAVDASGNVAVTGTTTSTDFPVVACNLVPPQCGLNGGRDALVTKLTPLGTVALYSFYHGGAAGGGDDEGTDVAFDASGNLYVTGYAGTPDFPVTPGVVQGSATLSPPNNGIAEAFVTKLA